MDNSKLRKDNAQLVKILNEKIVEVKEEARTPDKSFVTHVTEQKAAAEESKAALR